MSLTLPRPAAAYDARNEAEARRALEREDKQNLKKGAVLDKILLRDTADGTVKTLTVHSGALVIA